MRWLKKFLCYFMDHNIVVTPLKTLYLEPIFPEVPRPERGVIFARQLCFRIWNVSSIVIEEHKCSRCGKTEENERSVYNKSPVEFYTWVKLPISDVVLPPELTK